MAVAPSRPRAARILAAAVLTIALLGAVAPGASPAPASPAAVFQSGQLRGMVIGSYNMRPSAMIGELDRLKSIGVNTVAVYVNLYVLSKDANAVERDPTLTPSDQELRAVIDRAHAAGLDVTLTPVLFSRTQPNLWRGVFTPSNPAAFFASWRSTMNHYATLAQQTGVKMIAIGSEQRSLHGYPDEWRRVAREARSRFGGLVTYHSGKDAGPDVVPFWDAVDVVSISAYFGLTKNPNPSYGELLYMWESTYVPYVRSIHQATGKPVVLAEVGYISANSATANPADGNRGGTYNPRLQADAYRAVLDSFADEPWMQGFVWFRWGLQSPPNDTSYSPRDKPAELILKDRWAPR